LALIRPVVSPILPFPANVSKTISFLSSGGDQVTGNILKVYNNNTNVLVYTSNLTSFILQNTITANSLVDGIQYKAIIQTKDINNNLSSESDPIVFYVLANPTITITNIVDGQVFNQNITFSANYSHAQSETLQSYLFNLYDNNQSLLQSYPNTFADGSSALTQLVQGLANNTLYYIEVKTVSVNGQQGSSGLISFTPFFVKPSLYSTLTTTSNSETGSILIESIIIQELGNMDTGIAIYQDDTWIDLTQGGQVSFSDGFKIDQSEFLMKIWCKNVPIDTVFCKLYAPNGRIEFFISDNRIHAYIYLDGLNHGLLHFVSNEVIIGTDDAFMIYVKYQYYLLDLFVVLI